MILSLIAALDLRDGIGKAGRVPWRLRADLKLFKTITLGHHIMMGRKTYESIGQSLPGRTTIVLTRHDHYAPPECLLAAGIGAGIGLAESRGESELFVIGGGQVFGEALPLAEKMYLTRVQTDAGCEVFFPSVDWRSWVELERGLHPRDPANEHAFVFSRLVRAERWARVKNRP